VDLAGIDVLRPGRAALLMGSTLIAGVVRAASTAPAGLRACPHVGDGWFVGGWTSTAGRALAWARSILSGSAGDAEALEPGASGVLALPYLDGERAPVWDPAARGALVGLTVATSPAQVYRGVLDGVVLSALDLARRLEPIRDGDPWVVAGGGVRDAAWLEATADAFGEPLEVLDVADAVPAARVGLRALGIDPPPLASRTVEPDGGRHERWRRLFDVYLGLYDGLADAMHRLGALAAEDQRG
jgi:xylulokinase